MKLEKIKFQSIKSGVTVQADIAPRTNLVNIIKPPSLGNGVHSAGRTRSAIARHRNQPTVANAAPEEQDVVKLLRQHAEDLNFLFKTVDSLHREMQDLRSEPSHGANGDPLVTQNLQLLTHKVGEVDSLKFEIEMLHTRIKRLEDENQRLRASRMDPPPVPRRASSSKQAGIRGEQTSSADTDQNVETMQIDPSLTGPSESLQMQQMQGSNADRAEDQSQDTTEHRQARSSPGRKPRHYAETAREARTLNHVLSHLERGNDDDDEEDELQTNDGDSEFPTQESEFGTGDFEDDDESRFDDYSTVGGDYQRDDDYDDLESEISYPGQHLGVHIASANKRRRSNSPTPSTSTMGGGGVPGAGAGSGNPAAAGYHSIWAPETGYRPERGLMITRDGRIDGRSLRFEGKGHYKRQGPRDADGYLLRADGSRDKRSVRIINAMKKRQAEKAASLQAEKEMQDREARGEVVTPPPASSTSLQHALMHNGPQKLQQAASLPLLNFSIASNRGEGSNGPVSSRDAADLAPGGNEVTIQEVPSNKDERAREKEMLQPDHERP